MDEQFQHRLVRLQADLHTRLRDVRDVRKVLVYGLRATKELFGADEAAVAVLRPGQTTADLIFSIPQREHWDGQFLARYIAGARPDIPEHLLLAPIKRRDRNWAVLALQYDGRHFKAELRNALFSITQILTDIVQIVEERKTRSVRRKIERKIADRQEPKDLMYDILHGLRSLTSYDHSASLLVAKDKGSAFELVAEQIAWTKAKSKRIGLHLALYELWEQLLSGGVRLFERAGGVWRNRHGKASSFLSLLDYSSASGHVVPPEVSMVCAPLATPDGAVGILKISARRPGVLGDYEARLVEDFIPLTSLAVQFSVRTESLHKRILQSERKHALANLTRGIAHDVNNALGAMLPLVQQMREDTENGRVQPSTLCEDLESIERSIQTCRRIFGGMLTIARGAERGIGHGNLRRAIDGALSVLEDTMKRRSIAVVVELPRELPTIRGSQGDLTQVFLNICANGVDAMPRGGKLQITARAQGESIQVVVQDTGCGISPDLLDRVTQPFFTTKDDGNGLGLAICRSVLWDIGGDMRIESSEGEGTTLFLSLPILEDEQEVTA